MTTVLIAFSLTILFAILSILFCWPIMIFHCVLILENESFESLESGFKNLSVSVPLYRIVRDDLQEDAITKLQFNCYDSAYDELERFYGDLCCSDERIEYSIVSI